MKKTSPFAGMDPFLERHWPDVHLALMVSISDALEPQLPEDLVARIKVQGHAEREIEPLFHNPNSRVIEHTETFTLNAGEPASDLAAAAILLQPLADPIPLRSVLIHDHVNGRAVTAIEILSPWTKSPGKGREQYLAKRQTHIDSEVNLIEIDLIRAGDWTAMVGPYLIPKRALTTYRVTVVQPELPGPLLYPISNRAKLPTIKIPLRPQDAPATLNLQELLDKAYEMGRYYRMDYTQPCMPELAGPEKEWVAEMFGGRAGIS